MERAVIAAKESGRTFDLEAIASGSNGALVTNTKRTCRLKIVIHAMRKCRRRYFPETAIKNPIFEISINGKLRKTFELKGKSDDDGVLKIDRTFILNADDKDPILSMQIYSKSFFGTDLLGQIKDIAVNDLLQACSERMNCLNANWYELYSKDMKKRLPQKVLMQLAAAVAAPEQRVHIFVGTWNVGNSQPDDDLSAWIPATVTYDIVAIGAQECEYTPRPPHADCEKDWMATLTSALGSNYKAIHALSRGQMRLALFSHVDAEKAISDIQSGSEATGVGNVIANKGGVCIALKFWDTSLCFVNCHLAAHVGQTKARNEDYREIVGNMRINDEKMDILNQFHHLFWLGDLNYRINVGASDGNGKIMEKDVWSLLVEKIHQKNFTDLLKLDELKEEKMAGRAFYSFKEGQITFAPTFKMKRELENTYDAKRLPAWCDRILWSSLPGCDIKQLSYTSTPSITASDHKPVAATFSLMADALPCNSLDDLDEEDKRWHLRFTVLRARNLRASNINGYSDPCVSFVGSNLFVEAYTTVRFQNLNPVWHPLKELPTLIFDTFAIKRLVKEYVMVRIVDQKFLKSSDNVLGYGVIPLRDAVHAFKRKGKADFVAELSHKGCPAGTLEGTMKLTWEKNAAKRMMDDPKNLLGIYC